jgi:iron complex transport system substrate-binding protein
MVLLAAVLRRGGLALLLALWLPGCHRAPADVPAKTFTDDLGRTLSLESPLRRVVSMAPSLTEVVFAAGAGDRLVGVTTVDNYPPAVDTLPRFDAFNLNFEAVAALNPDLVLATDQVNNPQHAETLAGLGIPTVFLSFRSLEDVMRGMRTVGRLLGTASQAEAAAVALEQSRLALQAHTDTVSTRPLVLFLIGDETLYSFGPESYIHALIALAGGRSATAALTTEAPILSEEFVLNARPDVIVGGWGTAYDPARLLALHPAWANVPALRDGRVYSLDPDLVLRPGPRLLEAARQMARLLHPELPPPP